MVLVLSSPLKVEYGSGKLEAHCVADRFAFHLMWKNENTHIHTQNPSKCSIPLHKASTILLVCNNVDQCHLILAENPVQCRISTQNILRGCENQWDWEVLRIWKCSTVTCIFLVKFSFCFVYYKEEQIYPWLLLYSFQFSFSKYHPMAK